MSKMEILIIIGICYISIMGVIIKILVQRDKKIKLEKYRIDIEFGVDNRSEVILNSIIDNVFDEYRFYNLEFREDSYIKEIDEKEIIMDICNMVTDRISPVLMTQLSTYFNSNSIGNIIASKISSKVMEYRIMRNNNIK